VKKVEKGTKCFENKKVLKKLRGYDILNTLASRTKLHESIIALILIIFCVGSFM